MIMVPCYCNIVTQYIGNGHVLLRIVAFIAVHSRGLTCKHRKSRFVKRSEIRQTFSVTRSDFEKDILNPMFHIRSLNSYCPRADRPNCLKQVAPSRVHFNSQSRWRRSKNLLGLLSLTLRVDEPKKRKRNISQPSQCPFHSLSFSKFAIFSSLTLSHFDFRCGFSPA